MSTTRRKKKPHKKTTYRGYELENLIGLNVPQLIQFFTARARRRMNRGLKRTHRGFLEKVKAAHKVPREAHEKPPPVKTHLRNMIILPEMVGAQIGCHNGKAFSLVDVKSNMIGNYLAEYSITYRPVKHGHICKNFHSKFLQEVK